MLKVGVISVQGAIFEHVEAVKSAAAELGLKDMQVVHVRRLNELDNVDGLVIPGGESTTIAKLLIKFKLYDRIKERVTDEDLPILGTCAGCITLATEGDLEVEKTDTKLLRLMDMRVKRNAFGRQRESFEADIKIEVKNKDFEEPYHAVFIRAPVIEKVWGKCRPLARLEDKIVLAKQGNLVAAAFHPELTDDLRVHKYFLEMV